MIKRRWWYKLKVFFGADICPQCGSQNITAHGFENENQRYKCKDCGIETHIYNINGY